MASDIELINRMRAGDSGALAELYTRYLPVIWRYAFAHLRPDESAARDAVSDTFLAAMQALHDPDRGSVAGWLMGIARHKVTDVRRRRPPCELPNNLAIEGCPADSLTLQETREAVTRILLALEDEQRLVLEWKYLDGISVRDIAMRLSRTERAAESLLFRARDEFRQQSRSIFNARGELK